MKIRKIIWKQFGEPCVSIKKSKLREPITLEVLEKGASGNRYYPKKYKISKDDAKTEYSYSWGDAYIIPLDALESKETPKEIVESVKKLSSLDKEDFFKQLSVLADAV
tara:strand:+ start:1739 stop:2062 length:324 start_codon:yes stop_codon:yes gene_type:complete